MASRKGSGWRNHSREHALAARGIRTKYLARGELRPWTTIRVTLEDGNTIVTPIRLSLEEAKDYYFNEVVRVETGHPDGPEEFMDIVKVEEVKGRGKLIRDPVAGMSPEEFDETFVRPHREAAKEIRTRR